VLAELAAGIWLSPRPPISSLGHALYALAVAGIAFFAAALAESAATAAIVTLAFTLGFWVLDFAAATGPEWLKTLGGISPTQVLKSFERGLFPAGQTVGLAALGLGLAALSALILPPGLANRQRWQARRCRDRRAARVLAATSIVPRAVDLAEDRRNSFNPADEAALARMDRGLAITLHLNPRTAGRGSSPAMCWPSSSAWCPDSAVRWAETGKAGVFGAAGDEGYGRIVYEYGEPRARRSVESRSNSPREILPLLHELAGVQVTPVETAAVSGPSAGGRCAVGGNLVLRAAARPDPARRLAPGPNRATAASIFRNLHPRRTSMKLRMLSCFICRHLRGSCTSPRPRCKVSILKPSAPSPSPSPPPWATGSSSTHGGNKRLSVNGAQWARGQTSAGLADKARALYGERYAEFLDNVQSYAYFPIAVMNEVADFRDGHDHRALQGRGRAHRPGCRHSLQCPAQRRLPHPARQPA
jgi:hypothetical protein